MQDDPKIEDGFFMFHETEYAKKIRTFSKSTMQLIMNLLTSKENVDKIHEIVISCKTEDEAVKRMKTELTNKNI